MKEFMGIINALAALIALFSLIGFLLIGKFGTAWLMLLVLLYLIGNVFAIGEEY